MGVLKSPLTSNRRLSGVESLLQGLLKKEGKDISDFCDHITAPVSNEINNVLLFRGNNKVNSQVNARIYKSNKKFFKLF